MFFRDFSVRFTWTHQQAGLSRFGPVGCLTELPGTYFALHLFCI